MDSQGTTSFQRALLTALLCSGLIGSMAYWFPEFGSSDLQAFWAGSCAVWQGQNPYSGEIVAAIQRGIWGDLHPPQMFLNPPWVIPFLLPLGVMDWESARLVWVGVSVFILLISVFIIRQRYFQLTDNVTLFVALSVFPPTFAILQSGQLSSCLLLGVVLAFRYDSKKHPVVRAAALTLMMIKPQSIYLFFAALVIEDLRSRNYRPLLLFAGAISILGMSAVLMRSSIFFEWFAGTGYPLQWRTASLVTYLRDLFTSSAGVPSWPVAVVPALGLFGVAIFSRFNKFSAENLPYVLLVSVITAPYVWIYDLIVLLPIWFCLFSLIPTPRTRLQSGYSSVMGYGALLIVCAVTIAAATVPFLAKSAEGYVVIPLVLAFGCSSFLVTQKFGRILE